MNAQQLLEEWARGDVPRDVADARARTAGRIYSVGRHRRERMLELVYFYGISW